MKRLVIGVLSLLAFAAAAQAELPEYTVMRTTGKIVLDGKLDESDWAAAPAFSPFVFKWYESGDKEQTEVKMLWDDTFLYVAYKCDDKWIWADHYDTNSDTYQDDCVEMFWDPSPADTSKRKYNMFEINCLGNLLSVYVGSGVDIKQRVSRIMVPHIAQAINGTVNKDDDTDTGWIIEMAVCFSDYKEIYSGQTPKDGDMWRVGLNRCGGKTNEQFSQWSPSQTDKPNYHRPEDFGKIFFSTKKVQ